MMKRFKYVTALALLYMLPAMVVFADGAFRMVGLPFEPVQNISVQTYLEALYRLAIGIAALLAVVKLVFAGAKYILSDVITSKEDAKQDIRSALIGLLIVISAVLILNTINPELRNVGALDSLDGLGIQLRQSAPPTTGFEGTYQPQALGSNINWDTATSVEREQFINDCDGDVVRNDNSSGVSIASCVLSADAPIDVDAIEDAQFLTDSSIEDVFLIRDSRNQISSQVGTTIQPGDVHGYIALDEIPGNDPDAFSINLQSNCETVGGSHVAHTYFGGQNEFWCVGRVAN